MERLVYQSKRKEQSRGNMRVRMVRWLFLGGMVLSALIYIPHIPQLQVETIEVEGVDAKTALEIRAFAVHALAGTLGSVVPRRMFFAIRSTRLAERITHEFPKLKEVQVRKRFPDSLAIQASERELFAILCNDKERDTFAVRHASAPVKCAYLDADGIAYSAAPVFAGRLILKIRTDFEDIGIGREALTPPLIKKFGFITSALALRMGIAIESIELSERVPSEFRVAAADGLHLFFRVEDEYENVLRVLGRVLEDEIGDRRESVDYIDLRFGNKVFYKFK